MSSPALTPPPVYESYLQRWQHLRRPARLYLLHAALLTSSLAIIGLLFNLAVLALGFSLDFLGLLNTVSFAAAAVLSVPLLWLVTRVSLRAAMLASAALQIASVLLLAFVPIAPALLLSGGLAGAAAVLFQVSAPPFMMRQSDLATRDHLFSANAAILIGFAGLGSLLAGRLPGLAAQLLGVAAESGLAYRAAFAVASVGLVLSTLPLLVLSEAGNAEPADDHKQRGLAPLVSLAPQIESQLPEDRLYTKPKSFANLQSTIYNLQFAIPASWRELLRHPVPLVKLSVSPALISIGAALLIPYLNLFFKQRFAVADSQLGLIFAGLGLITALAALAAPVLSARLGKIRAIVLTQALALPFLALLGATPLLGIAVGAALVRSALFNMGTPLYDAFAMERTDEAARPAVIGVINGAYSIGYLFAPLVSTQIQSAYGFTPLFVITLICYMLAVLAKYWFFVRGSAPHKNTATPEILE
jgi:MFS family permease